eukprot:5460849-Amphidinium_carterae.1
MISVVIVLATFSGCWIDDLLSVTVFVACRCSGMEISLVISDTFYPLGMVTSVAVPESSPPLGIQLLVRLSDLSAICAVHQDYDFPIDEGMT